MSKLAKVYGVKAFVLDVDGVLSANTCQLGEDGRPIRTANLKDGLAIVRALESDFKVCIITSGTTEAVRKRYELLGVKDIFMGVTEKLPVLEKWLDDNELSSTEVAYMGDDIPDLECLRIVGLAACPFDASPEILHVSDFVSKLSGGAGCVRDLIESVMRSHGKWENTYHNYEALEE
ncbi:MAG: 3-deoxy-D-manno-octulosonate 8-phosphate phosphatase [Muribaculaceae bacterium]|nr:3-deoxy-D-manno-octulosonate 8-phosphate phosphatase [Muribaculaceae bacterium]